MACYHISCVRASGIFYQFFEFIFVFSCFRISYERVLTGWSPLFATLQTPSWLSAVRGGCVAGAPGCKHDGVTPKNPLPEPGWSECRGPATAGKCQAVLKFVKSIAIAVTCKAGTGAVELVAILRFADSGSFRFSLGCFLLPTQEPVFVNLLSSPGIDSWRAGTTSLFDVPARQAT
jgi:hypothetical protein